MKFSYFTAEKIVYFAWASFYNGIRIDDNYKTIFVNSLKPML